MERYGMKNRYVCDTCGKDVITVNIDDGVTPFMILCKATPGCRGAMRSSFYQVPQELPAQFEWFRPESFKGYSRAMREHFENGGLDLREIRPVATVVEAAKVEPIYVEPDKKVSRKRRRRHH